MIKSLSQTFGCYIALNLLFTLYFYDFTLGESSGGVIFRLILKLLSVALILYGFGYNKRVSLQQFLALLFFGLSSALLFFRGVFLGYNDLQWLNVFLLLPLVLINASSFITMRRVFFKSYKMWLVLELYLIMIGYHLWENEAFIGGLGNPSSFGIVSIYFVFIALQERKYLWAIIGTLSLVMTKAMMPFLVFLLVVFLSTKYLYKGVLILIALVSVPVFLTLLEEYSKHLYLKLTGLIDFLSDGHAVNLASISVRLDFLESVSRQFNEPIWVLFGGVDGLNYNYGDSQFITYLTSFGVLLFAVFVLYLLLILIGIKFLKMRGRSAEFYFLISLLLLLITNRVLDYWPICLFFFPIINTLMNENSYS